MKTKPTTDIPTTTPLPPTSVETFATLEDESSALDDAIVRDNQFAADEKAGRADWGAIAAVAIEVKTRKERVKAAQDAHVKATLREALETSDRWARAQPAKVEAHDQDASDFLGELAALVDRGKSELSRRDSTVQQIRMMGNNHLDSALVRLDPAFGLVVAGCRIVDNHRRFGNNVAGIIAPLVNLCDNPALGASLSAIATNTAPLWRPQPKSIEGAS